MGQISKRISSKRKTVDSDDSESSATESEGMRTLRQNVLLSQLEERQFEHLKGFKTGDTLH